MVVPLCPTKESEEMQFCASKQDMEFIIDKTCISIPVQSDLFDLRLRRFSSSTPARAGPLLTQPLPRQETGHIIKEIDGESKVAVLQHLPGKCKRRGVVSLLSHLGFEDAVARVDMPVRGMREGNRTRTVGKGFAFVHFFRAADCRRFVQVAQEGLRIPDRASPKIVTAEVFQESKAGTLARDL